ncbi:YigZ family protein [Corynebacterium sp. sy017]|uniref:YigZ family protein n=1 Tax=unclassified Corynebacterium TaxID=2624378 RepID=UPI0011870581|nr:MULTISPECIES: YigZ family protein [unclassified Corynebacterium]MBP3087936.1 YigZ family protein [Corynebacterium sp. sy017]TSD92472.1 YigZ family protein [Corynebacterium sp. SY003]
MVTPRHYDRPAPGEYHSETEIKRSKFLCFISAAPDEQGAREFIAQIKRRYPDARHHCSAFIVDGSNTHPTQRSNDDGEPAGTAGNPMLDVLNGSGLRDIVAVTVRYFGGIKLGTGGLIHAYSHSVSSCLTQVRTCRRSVRELYQVSISYEQAGRVEAYLRDRDFSVIASEYNTGVDLTLAVVPGTYDDLANTLANLTSGTATIRQRGESWIDEKG